MLYLAYVHTQSEVHNEKVVLDGDTDLETLRSRVNAYMATLRMISYNRGVKQQIPEGKTGSPLYYGSGGGCNYTTWLTIEELKPLVVD